MYVDHLQSSTPTKFRTRIIPVHLLHTTQFTHNMKTLIANIVRMSFSDKVGKTAIETEHGTVWANGNVTDNRSTKVNIVVNEVGDTFVAGSDSKQQDANKKPIFLKGATVTRQKQSTEFKSFVPSVAEQFVAAAADRGMAVNFVVQG